MKVSFAKSIVALALTAASYVAAEETADAPTNVVKLTTESFEEFIKGPGLSLVEFFAPCALQNYKFKLFIVF